MLTASAFRELHKIHLEVEEKLLALSQDEKTILGRRTTKMGNVAKAKRRAAINEQVARGREEIGEILEWALAAPRNALRTYFRGFWLGDARENSYTIEAKAEFAGQLAKAGYVALAQKGDPGTQKRYMMQRTSKGIIFKGAIE